MALEIVGNGGPNSPFFARTVQRATATVRSTWPFLVGLGIVAGLSFSAPLESAPQTRTLTLLNTHTKERVSVTFKRNGRYISDGLKKLNYAVRDWRRNEVTRMDPKVFDLLWEVYKEVGASQPVHVVSGYRSPVTNAALRSRSRGVAKFSQHTLGKAIDFYIPGVAARKIREAAFKRQVGGVGYYPNSRNPFVHLDTGNVRAWPRMTRRQLARLFPDGKTLHLPSDGPPLKGYEAAKKLEAQGRLEKLEGSRGIIQVARNNNRGSSRDSETSGRAVTANAGGGINALLNRGQRQNAAPAAAPQPAPAPAPAAQPAAETPANTVIANAPVPVARPEVTEPAGPVVVANAPRPIARPADLDNAIALAALANQANENASIASYAASVDGGLSDLATTNRLASVPSVLRQGLPLSEFQSLTGPATASDLIDYNPNMPRPPKGAPMSLTGNWSLAFVEGTSHFHMGDPTAVTEHFASPTQVVVASFKQPMQDAPMGRLTGRAITLLRVLNLYPTNNSLARFDTSSLLRTD